MRCRRFYPSLVALALCALGAQAQTLEVWLPPAAQVAPVLQASPLIQAARARQEAQLQRARGLEAGSAEWALRLNQQQRRVRDPQERFAETTLALERPLRLWGKAGMDARIAEQDREVARIGLADALHEASRQLLTQWFAALRARLDADSAERERQLARELDRQAHIRLREGDISPLDARLAEAELQRGEAAVRLAQAELARSTAQLQRLYPGLPEPRWPEGEVEPPAPPAQALEAALQDFLAHHHELNLLRAEARRQQLLAERIERDRWPDPSVGLYTARERAGGEQLVGVSVAMPLSGTWRESQARAALAESQALAQRVQQLERQLGADFEARWLQLAQQQQAVVALRAAATTQRLAADKSLTAYTLGEHSMTELIQNRRLANEQQLASQRLLLEGLLSRALIELDAHRLWDLDD
jgi:outer membrane protein TolC